MASPRKRPSSGFSTEGIEELPPSPDIEGEQETDLQEVIEEVVEDLHVDTYVEMSITPVEDPGPRFVEVEEVPLKEQKPQPVLLNKPKRHPRNIPKFSAWS